MARDYTQAQMSPATVVPGLVFPVFITRLLAVITRVHPIYIYLEQYLKGYFNED